MFQFSPDTARGIFRRLAESQIEIHVREAVPFCVSAIAALPALVKVEHITISKPDENVLQLPPGPLPTLFLAATVDSNVPVVESEPVHTFIHPSTLEKKMSPNTGVLYVNRIACRS